MSAKQTSLVWTDSQARGPNKLVLLALADHADRRGEAELSLRDMAVLCGLSKSRIQEILFSLEKAGELRILDSGSGRGNPGRYWITLRAKLPKRTDSEDHDADPDESVDPDVLKAIKEGPGEPRIVQSKPEFFTPTKEPQHTKAVDGNGQAATTVQRIIFSDDVMAVLKAAKVKLPEDKPFFWTRREHRDDLAAMLERTGCTVESLCERFRQAAEAGRGVDYIPTRLTQLEPMLGRKGAR